MFYLPTSGMSPQDRVIWLVSDVTVPIPTSGMITPGYLRVSCSSWGLKPSDMCDFQWAPGDSCSQNWEACTIPQFVQRHATTMGLSVKISTSPSSIWDVFERENHRKKKRMSRNWFAMLIHPWFQIVFPCFSLPPRISPCHGRQGTKGNSPSTRVCRGRSPSDHDIKVGNPDPCQGSWSCFIWRQRAFC